ncbi:BTB domain-containing protein [Mycena kentingensis (nom. inval.)]|nr:BTB domain-containing protein [Mycena kentingensis (nom. inval.)]
MDVDATRTPVKAEGLWWEDCGLVIQAENTVYRVSRDQLASHSPVFRDMLLLPPPQDAETFEGCPLVRVPDKADDVTTFFKALFSYDYFPQYPFKTTLAVVRSVLRMSDKYGVDGLRARALAHLDAIHPTKFGDWKKMPNPFSDEFNSGDGDPVGLLSDLRKLSLTWMLPVAFYRACDLETTTILHTAQEISAEDGQRALTGLRRLEGQENAAVLDFLWEPSVIAGCDDMLHCMTERLVARRQALTWGFPLTGGYLPLQIWVDTDWASLQACNICCAYMHTAQEDAIRQFWNRLPEIFDLPSWEELEEERRRVMQL